MVAVYALAFLPLACSDSTGPEKSDQRFTLVLSDETLMIVRWEFASNGRTEEGCFFVVMELLKATMLGTLTGNRTNIFPSEGSISWTAGNNGPSEGCADFKMSFTFRQLRYKLTGQLIGPIRPVTTERRGPKAIGTWENEDGFSGTFEFFDFRNTGALEGGGEATEDGATN